LRNPLQKILFHGFVLPAIFAAALALAPVYAAGQASSSAQAPNAGQIPNAAPANSTSASAPTSASTAAPAPKTQEEQEQALLHAPIVQSLARMLHLNLDTTIFLLLGINFAIIFFAVGIPLARVMPKIIRKRSQTLSQDLETARAATADAQSRLSAVEAKLAGLGEEMQKFRNQVEQDSIEDEKRIKASLGEESARIVAAAEQEIGVAATQIRRGLRDFAADLAIDQATRQLNLTPETDRALIAEFVAGVSADAPGKGGRN
jgi:F-type H+-transporting ATPase subunit b